MITRIRVALLLALLSPLAAAAQGTRQMSADGTVFSLLRGDYAELFEEPSATPSGDAALAIEVRQPDGAIERLIVPLTDDADPEGTGSLIASPDGSIFVVWEHLRGGIFSELWAVRYDAAGWSVPLRLAVHPFDRQEEPILAVTHSEFTTSEFGQVLRHSAIVLHVFWSQQLGTTRQVFYEPVVVLDGELPEQVPFVVLNSMLPETTPVSASADPGFYQALSVVPGLDGSSLVVTFGDEERQQIASVRISASPGELGVLADYARDAVAALGPSLFPEDLPTLAERVRGHIGGYGFRVHPAVTEYLAEVVTSAILAADPAEVSLPQLAERIRGHIGGYGSRLFAEQGLLESSTVSTAGQLIEIASGGYHQLIRLDVTAAYPLVDGLPSEVTLVGSPGGRDVVVAWRDESNESLDYRIATEGGWTDVARIHLDDDVLLADAMLMLEALLAHR